jgi:hypothetical protein
MCHFHHRQVLQRCSRTDVQLGIGHRLFDLMSRYTARADLSMTSTKVCVAELRPSVHVDVRFQITANLISTTEIRAQSLTLANDPTRTLTYTKRLQSGQKAIMGRQPPEAEQPGSSCAFQCAT